MKDYADNSIIMDNQFLYNQNQKNRYSDVSVLDNSGKDISGTCAVQPEWSGVECSAFNLPKTNLSWHQNARQ